MTIPPPPPLTVPSPPRAPPPPAAPATRPRRCGGRKIPIVAPPSPLSQRWRWWRSADGAAALPEPDATPSDEHGCPRRQTGRLPTPTEARAALVIAAARGSYAFPLRFSALAFFPPHIFTSLFLLDRLGTEAGSRGKIKTDFRRKGPAFPDAEHSSKRPGCVVAAPKRSNGAVSFLPINLARSARGLTRAKRRRLFQTKKKTKRFGILRVALKLAGGCTQAITVRERRGGASSSSRRRLELLP